MKSPASRSFKVHRALSWIAGLVLMQFFLASSSPAVAASGKCNAPVLLDPVCEAGKTAVNKVGDIATAPFRYAANSTVDMITNWVADGAHWLLSRVIAFIDTSTSPDLGAGWFQERYTFMIGLAALVLVPMLLVASIRAVMNQDASQLLRSFFVYLPIAVLGTFIAVVLVQTLLAVTDQMSSAVVDGIGRNVADMVPAVSEGLRASDPAAAGAPSFAVFFGALLLIVGCLFVWLQLLVRSAAVTVSVFFLPLMLAGLVWPTTARWTRRLVETLVALILSKFVIVAVISLATAALADPGRGGFGALMGAAALMLMAAFSPMALLKMIPIAEGAAVSHLEGMGRKPIEAVRRGGAVNNAVSIMRKKMSAGRAMAPRITPVAAAPVAAHAANATRKPGRALDELTKTKKSRGGRER
jgi:hypothetical protein